MEEMETMSVKLITEFEFTGIQGAALSLADMIINGDLSPREFKSISINKKMKRDGSHCWVLLGNI